MLCLDFVNTVDLRHSARVESLHSAADLIAWAGEHGVPDEGRLQALSESARRDPSGAVSIVLMGGCGARLLGGDERSRNASADGRRRPLRGGT